MALKYKYTLGGYYCKKARAYNNKTLALAFSILINEMKNKYT